MKKNKIIEPCKEIHFREIYRMDGVKLTYYAWERSRIKALWSAIERAFFIVILAFRILMRISPSMD